MRLRVLFFILPAFFAFTSACSGGGGGENPTSQPTPAATSRGSSHLPQGSEQVDLDPADFIAEIDNQYWPMRPGSRWVYAETDADGTQMSVEVTVTTDTKVIQGINATVVHDIVTADGEVIENTFDWYAQDVDGNIWYLGEDTKEYENGEVVSTEGSWEHGVDGAMAGVTMPANPVVGMSYRQEYYEGEAEDRARVLSVGDHVEVPFDTYDIVLRTEDTTPLEPDVLEHKYYAPFVGPVLTVDVNNGGRGELTLFEPARTSGVPELTPDEQARAREIILSDPRVAEVRGESSMAVDEAAIWSSGSTKLGAGAHIHFDPPVTWEGKWQFVIFDTEDPEVTDIASIYHLETTRARVEDMVEARVLVDLTNGAVLTIRPVSRSSFTNLEPATGGTPVPYR